eukprot:TRINITY_DN11001_c0_g3_i2.p4 TRINITY_DN11001_c0_g3~~TRINITY_DN11001_c0_g3_i2.p4  ORF type:complete len:102 (-),score=37.95 TRINITY_DN11001_c0_g3_i2:1515-1820(-)
MQLRWATENPFLLSMATEVHEALLAKARVGEADVYDGYLGVVAGKGGVAAACTEGVQAAGERLAVEMLERNVWQVPLKDTVRWAAEGAGCHWVTVWFGFQA